MKVRGLNDKHYLSLEFEIRTRIKVYHGNRKATIVSVSMHNHNNIQRFLVNGGQSVGMYSS